MRELYECVLELRRKRSAFEVRGHGELFGENVIFLCNKYSALRNKLAGEIFSTVGSLFQRSMKSSQVNAWLMLRQFYLIVKLGLVQDSCYIYSFTLKKRRVKEVLVVSLAL